MKGYSCYIDEVGGQNARAGQFSLQMALDERRKSLIQLQNLLHPSSVCLYGNVSGGTVPTWLASEIPSPDNIVLYETFPMYSAEYMGIFAEHAVAAGVTLSPTYADEFINTEEASPCVTCRVLLLRGGACTPPVALTGADMERLANSFSSANCVTSATIKGADHAVTRGSGLGPLLNLLHVVENFIDKR